mmetsp:Transcript_13231/g.21366  ORF Transcript_13231/g.21366 Transcript_13231/m.21366 type:complete len:97 (-) Transcript_13231:122-412(-)
MQTIFARRFSRQQLLSNHFGLAVDCADRDIDLASQRVLVYKMVDACSLLTCCAPNPCISAMVPKEQNWRHPGEVFHHDLVDRPQPSRNEARRHSRC